MRPAALPETSEIAVQQKETARVTASHGMATRLRIAEAGCKRPKWVKTQGRLPSWAPRLTAIGRLNHAGRAVQRRKNSGARTATPPVAEAVSRNPRSRIRVGAINTIPPRERASA
jgi:hypothetical protein